MHWIECARKVVKEKQYAEHDGVFLDLTTASMLVRVYDSLKEKNRKRFHKIGLERAVSIGWKCVR